MHTKSAPSANRVRSVPVTPEKKKTGRVPSYCRHKQTGGAFVTINGHQHRLGKYGTPESMAAYGRIIAEYHARATAGTAAARFIATAALTVSDVIAAFWTHATAYYVRPDGSPAAELDGFRYALRLLRHLYGETLAIDFGPKSLKALREAMIRPLEWKNEAGKEMVHLGWCRTNTNMHINRIRHVFKWAASEELLPGSICEALRAVDGLRRGRTVARESSNVKPADASIVQRVLDHLPSPVKAMVQVEAITGARGGELCQMRGCDLDKSNPDCWIFTPATHKTAHHGHARKIPLGRRCQEILRPFLQDDPQAHLFSPARWEQERRAKLHQKRLADPNATPLQQGNRPGTNKRSRPQRTPGESYNKDTYGRAVTRACELAFPPPPELAQRRVKSRGPKQSRLESTREWRKRIGVEGWLRLREWRVTHRFSPHRLRHSAATFLRKNFGLEAARVILGHSCVSMTELYAEQDQELAIKVMTEIG